MKKQAFLSLFTGGSGGGIPFMANGGAVSKGKPVVVGKEVQIIYQIHQVK